MFPTDELTKNGSHTFKLVIAGIGVAWVVATIIHTYSNYQLAKTNKKLAEIQIRKLASEGFK